MSDQENPDAARHPDSPVFVIVDGKAVPFDVTPMPDVDDNPQESPDSPVQVLERPEWVRKLKQFISDDVMDCADYHDSDEVTLDLIETAVDAILCNTYGHEVVDDQCGNPAHRYCVWCTRRESQL